MVGRIGDELAGVDLGDQRLNTRSRKIIEALAVDSKGSINAAFEDWSDTLAAYRLFDNPAVTPEAILQPHLQATLARIATEPVVLIAQDTTELDFSKHPPKDARCLTKANRFGLYQHTHLAVTPAGLALGVVGVAWFDRAAESLGKSLERRGLPIEEKESFRWLEGARLARALSEQCPGTQIVSLADREADIYEIFLEIQEHKSAGGAGRVDYLIRSKENRFLNQRVPPAEHGTRYAMYRKLRDEVRDGPVRSRKTIELSATPRREARAAELEIRAQTVTLRHPKNRAGLPEVTCQVVHVLEVGEACLGLGEEEGPIEWWLITSLPVDSVEEIERVVAYYQGRWTIEVYFRTFKTGCQIEEIQLETNARLKNCLAFYVIIAWRVLHLTMLNRTEPDAPCTTAFADEEWQPVWCVTKKRKLPKKPPRLGEFLRLLASLGGYNNRRGERPPGPQPIWTGLRRMADLSLAWLTFGPGNKTYV